MPTQIQSGQTIIELPTRTKIKTFQRKITDYRIHNFYSASSVALNMTIKNYYTDTGKHRKQKLTLRLLRYFTQQTDIKIAIIKIFKELKAKMFKIKKNMIWMSK